MVVDLLSLKKDIEEYPGKMRAALQREHDLEARVETLQEEIETLEGADDEPPPTRRSLLYTSPSAILRDDPELLKMRRDKERLRQKKFAAVSKDPTAYELPPRATQKMIEAVAAQV